MITVNKELLYKLIQSGLAGNQHDLGLIANVLLAEIEKLDQELASKINTLLNRNSLRSMQTLNPHPVSNFTLPTMLQEVKMTDGEIKPVLSKSVNTEINEIILENKNIDKLKRHNLTAVKTIIFDGPPGVGKTYSAKWIGRTLNLPVYVLDLATVMNSHLGKTGNNIKEVFSFIAKNKCVLLLDEFDAIAKKRDDNSDIGELKRLVTVLLQELDKTSEISVIIAATNHSELLDPAIWRRFEKKVTFEKPDLEMIKIYLKELAPKTNLIYFADYFLNYNFSDIQFKIQRAKKLALLSGDSEVEKLASLIYTDNEIKSLSFDEKKKFAIVMVKSGISQREAAKKCLLSRPTIKKELEKSGL